MLEEPVLAMDLIYSSITHSNINDETLQFLLSNITVAGSSKLLDLSFNNISVFPEAEKWNGLQNEYPAVSLVSLNFAHNQLREIPPLTHFPFSGSLQILNVSSNQLTEDSLHNLQFSNLSSLKTLDISNNQLYGEFPSGFMDAFPNLQNLYADNNDISGVLNLTIWHQNLQRKFSGRSNDTSPNQVFSFVKNNISNIYPDADAFQDPIRNWSENPTRFMQTGLLLGGNPYCENVYDITFARSFFCRSSLDQGYSGRIIGSASNESDIEQHQGLIIGGVLGGSFLILSCMVLSVIIWKLWKKVASLSEIQQELANRKVQPPFFSYHELKVATKDFHHKNKLGSGAFGAVFKGVLADKTTVAVKRLFNSQRKQVLREFLNEVILITGIKHKNLVQLKGCCIKDQERILVYEYAEKGNVAEALWGKDNDRVLDWKDRLNICAGIARGLSYLHEELQPRIIHRDIKPANILLDKNLNAKIADFGLAKHYLEEDNQADFTHFAGTRGYFAPEYLMEGQLTTKADVFSFGILVLEILSGRKSLDLNQPPDQVYLKNWAKKLQAEGEWMALLEPALRMKCPKSEVVSVINVALMCVRDDPQRRPTMSQVVTMLLGIMGDTIESLISFRVEELEFNRDIEGTPTSEYGLMKYENSLIFNESEEIPMIQTEPGRRVKSKFSMGNIRGEENAATMPTIHLEK